MSLVQFRACLRPSKPFLIEPIKTSPPTTPHIPRNLGNKLQVLAGRSPARLAIVEAFVDLMLKQASSVKDRALLLLFCLWF